MSDYSSFPEYAQTLGADCYTNNCPARENRSSNMYRCDNILCVIRCRIYYPWQKDSDIIYTNHT